MIRRLASAAIVVAWVGSASPAPAADDVPSADKIREHVLAVVGPPLASYRETLDETAFGLRRHSVVVAAGADYREPTDAGPLHTASGVYHGQRWRQNANGETILAPPNPGLVAPESYTTSVRRVTTPVDGYVVSSLDRAGYGTKRYVEAATWHEVRTESIRASGITVTTYEDFRSIGGHVFPFHDFTSDGHVENDRDTRIAEIRSEPIADAELVIPPARRAFVEFPSGETSVKLPVREDRGKFIVTVNVGTRALDMVLDSGAAGIVIEEGVAKQLGLQEFGSESNGVNSGRFRSTSAIVPEMSVGDLEMHDVAINTVPSVGVTGQFGEYRAVGLLGFDFIDAIVLELDYRNQTATAYAPQSFAASTSPDDFTLDLRVGNGQPMISIGVDGAVGERFVMDTGGFGSLVFFDRFVRRNSAALVDEGGGGAMRNVQLNGIGGAFAVKPYQLPRVDFGPIAFHDFLTYAVTQHGAYDGSADGIVGP
ncbi:MAG: clan AA aspartic protease, partial [Candidatus Eremiobacteraeota bacterium]|nr:clan AA aspartic protease [Candidatus Eremiobacteraeota bacterium]